ncbi:hypothetical protein HHI36_024020, partial [Cryptolaemus montrouzieri]
VNVNEIESIISNAPNDIANLQDFNTSENQGIDKDDNKSTEGSLHSNREPDEKLLSISEVPVNYASRRLILYYGTVYKRNFKKPFNKIHTVIQIPKETDIQMQKEIIDNYHQQDHNGISESYNKLKEEFYWPKLGEHITARINQCELCLQ